MTNLSVAELPVMLEEDTHAGNYFVSNYPPFSFWDRENAEEALTALSAPPVPGTPLGLYLHIPFCRRRCHFCYFKVYTDKTSSEIRAYLDYLKKELDLYKDQPFLEGRKPKFIYFGGGTPSFISANQLHDLTEAMKAALPWDEAEEIAFECEPGTLTETKLRAIRDIGVTRLSLGIENFDDKILEINGRAHRSPEIHRAYDFARSIEFPQINIDLIAGMIGETEENWQECLEKTIALEPDSITVYQMEIPFNTTIYQEMKEEGKDSAPVADWKTKRRWVREAFERLESAGYTIGSAYTAVKDPEKTKFLYRDELWTGADLLSLGVASFSHIHGVHFQNEKDNGPYFERLDKDEFTILRAYRRGIADPRVHPSTQAGPSRSRLLPG
jgi:oxygen-independent coproporphyrinogen-3 oxidase